MIRASGTRYHDWVLESFSWRLLHAAGIATMCSASDIIGVPGLAASNQTGAIFRWHKGGHLNASEVPSVNRG
jgi:hypothetical protein